MGDGAGAIGNEGRFVGTTGTELGREVHVGIW